MIVTPDEMFSIFFFSLKIVNTSDMLSDGSLFTGRVTS